MLKMICFISALVFGMTGQTFANDLPKVYLLNPESLAEVKSRVAAEDEELAPAVKKLRADADRSLTAEPYSVTFKEAVPPSGDKHDYMSMGTYWWPNPDTEDGLPYVRRDGEKNPEGDKLDVEPVRDMISHVNTLALAYYLTEHEPYAEHAAKLMGIWFLDEETKMNPHLNYAQGIPGRVEGRGIGIIDTWAFSRLIDSIGLLDESSAWTEKDQNGMKFWFTEYLEWLTTSKYGKDEEVHPNNHGTYYDLQAVPIAFFAGNKAVAENLMNQVAERRIAAHIEPDGSQPKELDRTLSLSYVIFNLDGLMDLARLGEHMGLDLWEYESEDGRSIRKAVDWCVPYILGDEEWTHTQIRNVSKSAWIPILRKAAINFNEPSYEKILESLDGIGLNSNRVNITNPKPDFEE